jgi:hypothetical protein
MVRVGDGANGAGRELGDRNGDLYHLAVGVGRDQWTTEIRRMSYRANLTNIYLTILTAENRF